MVVAVDKLAAFPCDVLDKEIQENIKSDLAAGIYDCLGVATPCETFSPLRENPPGPRPLRSMERPMGLDHKDLAEAKGRQLDEGNRMVYFSAEAIMEGPGFVCTREIRIVCTRETGVVCTRETCVMFMDSAL